MNIAHWTGREAAALQSALRLTNQTFADRLGIARRTVAGWHADPVMMPRMEMQQLLDELLSRLSPAELDRFHGCLSTDGESGTTTAGSEALRAAIAIVAGEQGVLVVRRRADNSVPVNWQFPAGIIKPEGRPSASRSVRPLPRQGSTALLSALSDRVYTPSRGFIAVTCSASTSPEILRISTLWRTRTSSGPPSTGWRSSYRSPPSIHLSSLR